MRMVDVLEQSSSFGGGWGGFGEADRIRDAEVAPRW